MPTHDVFNQVPPLLDYDLAGADPLLLPMVEKAAGGKALVDMLLSAFEGEARLVAESVAMQLQAGLLVENASPPVAEALVASRLERSNGTRFYGTLPFTKDLAAMVEEAIPA